MTAHEAVTLILDEKTKPETRERLRRRVHAVFDAMYAEAAGTVPRRNQTVWDALDRWTRWRRRRRYGQEETNRRV